MRFNGVERRTAAAPIDEFAQYRSAPIKRGFDAPPECIGVMRRQALDGSALFIIDARDRKPAGPGRGCSNNGCQIPSFNFARYPAPDDVDFVFGHRNAVYRIRILHRQSYSSATTSISALSTFAEDPAALFKLLTQSPPSGAIETPNSARNPKPGPNRGVVRCKGERSRQYRPRALRMKRQEIRFSDDRGITLSHVSSGCGSGRQADEAGVVLPVTAVRIRACDLCRRRQ